MALPSSADCECGPLRGKGMRERGAAYVIRARRCDRDRAEHARGGEESVAAVDTKRWRGGKMGRVRLASRETCASRRSCLRRTEGEGGVINQRTEAGRKEVCVWCDCGGWTEGTFSGRISMCGVCVCVVCVTESAPRQCRGEAGWRQDVAAREREGYCTE